MTTYRQEQPLRTAWVWAVVLAIALFGWWAFGRQLLFMEPVGSSPPPNWLAAILLVILGVGFPLFLWCCRLVIEVGDTTLRWQLRPFPAKEVRLADLARVEACTYSPIPDYLGWGIRYMPGKGWAYTIAGNRGVRLELHSGVKILLGSRDPETLAAHIDEARAKVRA